MSSADAQQSGSRPATEEQLQEATELEAGAEGEGEPEASALSLDLVFEVLKNQRRRYVLHYLKDRDERVTLSDLAEHVAARENDTTVSALTSSERKRVYVGLYQCHLPKMDDMDVIEFNQDRGIIELGPNAPQLDEYLENDGEVVPSWHRRYLALAGVGTAAFAGSVFGGAAVGVTPGIVLGGLVLALGGLSVLHAVAVRRREEDDESFD